MQSTDVYLAAALATVGIRPDKSTFKDGRVTFYWPDDVKVAANSYYEKELSVDARTFAEEIKSMKTLIHNPI